jgi:hypothetical protein
MMIIEDFVIRFHLFYYAVALIVEFVNYRNLGVSTYFFYKNGV